MDAAAAAAAAAAVEVMDLDAGADPGYDTVWPEELLTPEEAAVGLGAVALLTVSAIVLWRYLKR